MRLGRVVVSWLMIAMCAAGCDGTDPQGSVDDESPNLFRDAFHDGKFDESGHPLNARVTEAITACKGTRRRILHGAGIEVVEDDAPAGEVCRAPLEGGAQRGELVLNARLQVDPDGAEGELLRIDIKDGNTLVTSAKLDRKGVRRAGRWMNFSLPIDHENTSPLDVVLTWKGKGRLVVAYFELFPRIFNLAMGPGSGEFSDQQEILFETSLDEDKALVVKANEVDLSAHFAKLVSDRRARVVTTTFRKLVYVRVGDLLANIPGNTVDILASTPGGKARMQVRRALVDCKFEGDAMGKKVLLTGFHPFPADSWHENISTVTVNALKPSALIKAQVMRVILPVEYNQAAAEVVEIIQRCKPAVVISFGQGDSNINLEATAYNLQDTSEMAGGLPDNRGVIASARPIEADGPATRASRLPLDGIASALTAAGFESLPSNDPGRYICNNVFYAAAGATEGTSTIAGFIHLPFKTSFTDEERTNLGSMASVIVNAVAR